MNHRQEIECQRMALIILSGEHPEDVGKVLVLHPELAERFRAEINKFEAERNEIPTAEQLIWLTSETLHENIRDYFEEEI